MKRVLAIAIASMLLLSAFGCSGQQVSQTPTDSPAQSQTDAQSQSAIGRSPMPKENIKVGVIHIGDPSAGSGYTYTHDVGIQEMQSNLGLSDSQIIRKNNVDDGDPTMTETAIRECIEEGANIIVATSWGYMDTCEALASEFPNVIFSHGTGYKSNGENFNNYFGRIYQARYLSGIAAGLKTKSNKIGYVAAMGKENSEVTGGLNAFAMGIASVNPDAKVYVKVTNSWFDPNEETNSAKALIALGCDVIGQHCDTPNPQLEAESSGVWGVGYNSDMTKDAPNAVITSVIWNWGVYYTQLAQSVIDGTWTAANYFGGMDDGLVDITPLSSLAEPGTSEKVEEARARIKDGSFNVFDGLIKTNDGQTVGAEGETLDDAAITGGINWYYENVVVE
ncbi:MAG: BMP family ABC transporter substrate-binding protein [Clostridiales bacterium]|nr:BMP family ABC transporter substrate-binding protein [Clostridiales bacterium]